MTWDSMPLGEFVTLKRGYDLPSSLRVNGPVPVVSSSDVTGCHDAAKVRGPGVVTGRHGTLGEVFFVEEDFWPLNTALYVQDFQGNDPRFSAYLLESILTNTGSNKAAVPGVNRNDLHAAFGRALRMFSARLGVAVGDLNERIADTLEKIEVDDIDVAQRLERELRRDYHIITADSRLDQVARDFARHYSAAWETGKAMLVCIDKVTCVRMHALIERYWGERIKELEAERKHTTDEQEELYLQRQVGWMNETRAAVVVSEEQGEVAKFRKWELDILPHRRLIKEGMELPESMRGQPRFRTMQRMALDEAFKEEQHPFRIAIVCAMWLTGFDVPSLSTLYLDKPLKAHTLMQAAARANRVNEGKNNGLIVDYCGVLKHLRGALATFAATRPGGGGGEIDPARPDEELLDGLAEAIAMVRDFLDAGGAPLDDVIRKEGFARNAAIVACKEVANENDETRKRFEVLCREVFKKFKACVNVRGVNAHRADRNAIDVVYRSLQQDRERADIRDIIRVLHEVVDAAIDVRADRAGEDRPTYDISAIDFDRLKREFERSRSQRTGVQALKHTVEERLRRLLARNPLRTDFQQHYEQIVAEYNREKDRVTIERTFEELLKFFEELEEEENRALREELDEESLAVFDLLKKPDLDKADIRRIKTVAKELLRTLKAEKLRVDQWREKEATQSAVKVVIHDFLYSDETGLPAGAYSDDEVEATSEAVFAHVYRAYPEVPSPFYDDVTAA
jgi:type I restriction enzyme R subunit